ncbi:unnamed protein product [Mytilus edulis]|uniref:Uncharacterized protein n=1 Tax=Mytilus edulis TaxID=6550 RepID=A0A8S3SEP2_MYTED|nr:unnamed protein product [Mytilus edulis]
MQLLLVLLVVIFVSTRKTTLDLNPQISDLVDRLCVTGDETVQSLTTQQVADEDMNDKYYFDFVASDKRHLKEQLNTLQLDSYEYEQSFSVQSVKNQSFHKMWTGGGTGLSLIWREKKAIELCIDTIQGQLSMRECLEVVYGQSELCGYSGVR